LPLAGFEQPTCWAIHRHPASKPASQQGREHSKLEFTLRNNPIPFVVEMFKTIVPMSEHLILFAIGLFI
jgi:hypothetical protein